MTDQLIEVKNLKKHFDQATNFFEKHFKDLEPVQAVDDVTLSIYPNDVKGVIGESGCGKSTLLRTMLFLEEPTSGDIYYRGTRLEPGNSSLLKEYRRHVRFIFQDPYNSLNPRLTVNQALSEPLRIHDIDCDVNERVRQTLEDVQLSPPDSYLNKFPAELSGGERQRVSIGRALVVDPEVILADEPVSMLDVSTQASILRLLQDLRKEHDISIVYISHDLSTVAHLCDEINVMYLGRIVETGSTQAIISEPKHPYTKAMINANPVTNPHRDREFTQLPGSPSDPIGLGEGCRFRDRCPERMDICEKTPYFVETDDGHYTACHLYYDHETAEPGGSKYEKQPVGVN